MGGNVRPGARRGSHVDHPHHPVHSVLFDSLDHLYVSCSDVLS